MAHCKTVNSHQIPLWHFITLLKERLEHWCYNLLYKHKHNLHEKEEKLVHLDVYKVINIK